MSDKRDKIMETIANAIAEYGTQCYTEGKQDAILHQCNHDLAVREACEQACKSLIKDITYRLIVNHGYSPQAAIVNEIKGLIKVSDKYTEYPQYDNDTTTDCENCESRTRASVFEEVYNQLDKGVCDICEHASEGCNKLCGENGWEIDTFKKWLKGQKE